MLLSQVVDCAAAQPACAHTTSPVSVSDLDDDTLEVIFSKVSFDDRKDVLPLVCKRWSVVLERASPTLWEHVIIEPGLSTSEAPSFHQAAKWMRKRGRGIYHMRIRLFDYMSSSARRWSWLSGNLVNPVRRAAAATAVADAGAPEAAVRTRRLLTPRDTRAGELTASLSARVPHDAPLQGGFFAHIAPRFLTQLRTLYIMRSATVMNLADYRALGSLSLLEELTIINTQPSVDSARRAAPYAACDFGFLGTLFRIRTLRMELDMRGFPDALCSLDTLQELQLKHLRDARVPEQLAGLKSLTHLTLSDCGLTHVPPVICALTGLQELSLSMNELTNLWGGGDTDGDELFPARLTRLSALTALTLTCCDLETVPEVIGALSSLRELYLSGNRILASTHAFFMLPSSSTRLQDLRTLCLSCCKLEAAPLELCTLTALRTLNLSNNFVYDLPSTLHALQQLEDLDLRRNRLHFLPAVLSTLTTLRALDVSHNKLQYDQAAVHVAQLPRLDTFNFPSPNDTFQWSRSSGLGDPSGSTSTRYFAQMLAVLTLRSQLPPDESCPDAGAMLAALPTANPLFAQARSGSAPPPRTPPLLSQDFVSDSDDSSSEGSSANLGLGLERISSASLSSFSMEQLMAGEYVADGAFQLPHAAAVGVTLASAPSSSSEDGWPGADDAAAHSESPWEARTQAAANEVSLLGTVPHCPPSVWDSMRDDDQSEENVLQEVSEAGEDGITSSLLDAYQPELRDSAQHPGSLPTVRDTYVHDSFAVHGGAQPCHARQNGEMDLNAAACPAPVCVGLLHMRLCAVCDDDASSVSSIALHSLTQSPRTPERLKVADDPWQLRSHNLIGMGTACDAPEATDGSEEVAPVEVALRALAGGSLNGLGEFTAMGSD